MCMDKRVLTAIIVSLLMITSASAISFSEDSLADPPEYDSTGKISDTKELTFTGMVRYNILPSEGGEPNIIVLIGTELMDPAYNESRLSYVVEPSKTKIGSNGEFIIRTNRIIDPGLDYYFLIESGYEIEIVSSSLDGTPSTVYRYNYSDSPLSGAESYTAFKLSDTVDPADSTFSITGKTGEYDKIGAIHTTGTLFATTMDNNYRLSNVEIRLVREGEQDIDKYSFSGYTESDGTCTIKEISTGVYNLIAINENYEQAKSVQVVITKGDITTTIVEMDVLKMDGEYWGYDLPHFLMLCAGTVCIIIIVTSIILQHRRIKGKGGEWILNDVVEEDEEEKEE